MPACHPNPFRSERAARRRAWHLRNRGRTAEVIHCQTCGMWHITAPITPTAPTTTSHGG